MAEGREGKIMTSEWIEVVNDEDIMYLNNMYDDFEDALIVSIHNGDILSYTV